MDDKHAGLNQTELKLHAGNWKRASGKSGSIEMSKAIDKMTFAEGKKVWLFGLMYSTELVPLAALPQDPFQIFSWEEVPDGYLPLPVFEPYNMTPEQKRAKLKQQRLAARFKDEVSDEESEEEEEGMGHVQREKFS